MASIQSKQIRAAFADFKHAPEPGVEEGRQRWEAAVEEINRALRAAIQPVDVNGIPGEWVRDDQATQGAAILFVHGGGFTAGSSKTHRAMAARISAAARAPVLLIDYRLAPEQPFPAAVEDVVSAFRWLLEQGFKPPQIVLGGDSAGATLALSGLIRLRDEGVDRSAGAFLISPWVDLALTGESIETRAEVDPLTTREGLHKAAQMYLGERDPSDPLASPLNAQLDRLPPLLIQTGEHEILLDDATRLAKKAQSVGGSVQLEIWDEMWHVWHGWAPDLPEAQEAIEHIGNFVQQQLAAGVQATS